MKRRRVRKKIKLVPLIVATRSSAYDGAPVVMFAVSALRGWTHLCTNGSAIFFRRFPITNRYIVHAAVIPPGSRQGRAFEIRNYDGCFTLRFWREGAILFLNSPHMRLLRYAGMVRSPKPKQRLRYRLVIQ